MPLQPGTRVLAHGTRGFFNGTKGLAIRTGVLAIGTQILAIGIDLAIGIQIIADETRGFFLFSAQMLEVEFHVISPDMPCGSCDV